MSWSFKKNPPPQPEGFAGKFKGPVVMGFDEWGQPLKIVREQKRAKPELDRAIVFDEDEPGAVTESEFLTMVDKVRNLWLHDLKGENPGRMGQVPSYSSDLNLAIELLQSESERVDITSNVMNSDFFVVKAVGGERRVRAKHGKAGRIKVQVKHTNLCIAVCMAYALLKEKIKEV